MIAPSHQKITFKSDSIVFSELISIYKTKSEYFPHSIPVPPELRKYNGSDNIYFWRHGYMLINIPVLGGAKEPLRPIYNLIKLKGVNDVM